MKQFSIKKTIKNSYFLKMLLLYSGIFLLTCFTMIGILLYSQQKNQQDALHKSNQNILTQFQIYTDHYILDQVYSTLNQELYNNTLNEDNLLFNPQSYIHNRNYFDDILAIQKFFSNIVQNSSVIDSIYIYHQKYDTLVSTEKGCYYSITERRSDYQSMLPYDLLDYSRQQTRSQFWIPPHITASFYPDRNVVSLVQALPVFSPLSESNLLLILNLDLQNLYSRYLAEIDTGANELLVLDDCQNILYSTGDGKAVENTLPPQLADQLTSESEGSVSYTAGGISYTADWMHSSGTNWRYLYVTRQTNLLRTAIVSAGGVLTMALVISFLCLFVIYFISNWLYRPIRRLARYSALDGHAGSTDELSSLDLAFRNMADHIDQLQEMLDKNNPLILSNTIKELLNGAISSREELEERLAFAGEHFPYEGFYLLCIRVEDSIFASLDYQKRSLLQLGTVDLLNQYSFDSGSMHTKALSVFHHSGNFTTVINADCDGEDLLALLEHLMDTLTSLYGNFFNMAVSPYITDFSQLSASWAALPDYFKYYYIYGNHNIFTHDLITEYENNAALRAQVPLKLLTSLIRRHDTEAVKQEIHALFRQSKDGRNSLLYTYNLSLEIINLICTECESLGIHTDSLSHPYLVSSFSQISHLEDTVQWFCQVIDDFDTACTARSSSLDATLIPDILTYMSEHVDASLSLNSIADKFSLSTGHLSRLFKDKTGSNFSDYIIRLKMETAAHMLLEKQSMKVADIAESLGYSNISYFNKIFKETYSVTPTQYRRMKVSP